MALDSRCGVVVVVVVVVVAGARPPKAGRTCRNVRSVASSQNAYRSTAPQSTPRLEQPTSHAAPRCLRAVPPNQPLLHHPHAVPDPRTDTPTATARQHLAATTPLCLVHTTCCRPSRAHTPPVGRPRDAPSAANALRAAAVSIRHRALRMRAGGRARAIDRCRAARDCSRSLRGRRIVCGRVDRRGRGAAAAAAAAAART